MSDRGQSTTEKFGRMRLTRGSDDGAECCPNQSGDGHRQGGLRLVRLGGVIRCGFGAAVAVVDHCQGCADGGDCAPRSRVAATCGGDGPRQYGFALVGVDEEGWEFVSGGS